MTQDAITPTPTICRIVIYRSRTGDYDVPAIVTATTASINQKGVEAGYIPTLASDRHVHLTVFSPGMPGVGALEQEVPDFLVDSERLPQANQGGSYQEWDIPEHDPLVAEPAPGTWRWPERS